MRAAIEAYETELDVERDQFFAWAARGPPADAARTSAASSNWGTRGNTYRAPSCGASSARIDYRGARRRPLDLPVTAVARGELPAPRATRAGLGVEPDLLRPDAPRGAWSTQSLGYLVEVDGVAHRISRDSAGVVRATAPAIVVSIAAKPGDEVQAGDRLLVVEAMKMELALRAPFAGPRARGGRRARACR